MGLGKWIVLVTSLVRIIAVQSVQSKPYLQYIENPSTNGFIGQIALLHCHCQCRRQTQVLAFIEREISMN